MEVHHWLDGRELERPGGTTVKASSSKGTLVRGHGGRSYWDTDGVVLMRVCDWKRSCSCCSTTNRDLVFPSFGPAGQEAFIRSAITSLIRQLANPKSLVYTEAHLVRRWYSTQDALSLVELI